MLQKMTSINPMILEWARKENGLSLEQVKEKFKFGNKISDWEKGVDYPTYRQLQQLCSFYKKPVNICFFLEPPVVKNIMTSFRTISSNLEDILINDRVIQLINEARVLQINLSELNNNQNQRYLKFSSENFNDDIETMVKQLRDLFNVALDKQKHINSSRKHFEFWRYKFTQVGIYIFKAPFRRNDIAGFSLYDTMFPIIYVNNTLSFVRQIFTIFHEIYHIICKSSGIDFGNKLYYFNLSQDQINCNEFASLFLVPNDDFFKLVKNYKPTEEFVKKLALSYGVGRDVILKKFLDLGQVTQSEYIERTKQYVEDYYRDEKHKSGGDYYNNQTSYKGKKYIELVFEKYNSNQISIIQSAEYMNMRIPIFKIFAERKGLDIL